MNQSLIKAKEQEIAQSLEKWALERLGANQQIRISVCLEIVNVPVAQVKISTKENGRKPRRYLNYKSTNITEDDWAKILAIPWSGRSGLIIDELRQSGNIRVETYVHYTQLESMNLQFKKRMLDYRIKQNMSDRTPSWPKKSISLYIVEDRDRS